MGGTSVRGQDSKVPIYILISWGGGGGKCPLLKEIPRCVERYRIAPNFRGLKLP